MMSNPQSLNQPPRPPLHWPSLIQLILSLLAAFILLSVALFIILSAAVQYFTHVPGAQDPTGLFMMAASLALTGVLVLPSAWYAWKHLTFAEREPTYHPERRGFILILTSVVIILVGGALLIGNWVSQNNRIAWFLLPPLNILATGLPVLWVVYVGTRGLVPGLPRRRWGVFASGLVLGPLIILILELILLAFTAVLAILLASYDPSLSSQLNSLIIRLQSAGRNLDAILHTLVPFLLNPGILFLLFAYIAVLVPLLEEALKPIGVWFLSGQKISPAQGFGYGVLSGAGFGLFENLGNTSGGAAGWALMASTRIVTLVLHSFTAGLVGWALASAWSERRYLRLAATYAIAVLVHGLWNGMALLSEAGSLQGYVNISVPAYFQVIGVYSSWGILILGVIILFLYIGFNTILRHSMLAAKPLPPGQNQAPQPLGNYPPPPTSDESLQPPTELITTLLSPGDDPPKPESEPLNQQNNKNSTTTTGTN